MEFALDASQHHAVSVTRLHTLFKDALFCFWILLGFSYTLRYLKMGELDVLAGMNYLYGVYNTPPLPWKHPIILYVIWI